MTKHPMHVLIFVNPHDSQEMQDCCLASAHRSYGDRVLVSSNGRLADFDNVERVIFYSEGVFTDFMKSEADRAAKAGLMVHFRPKIR